MTLTDVQAQQEGAYRVVVSNEVGSTASSDAYFSFPSPPDIVSQSQPTNLSVIYRTNLSLSVEASGPDENSFPLSYQWFFEATNISGANAASYDFAAKLQGTYSVIVSNVAGTTAASWEVAINYDVLDYYLTTNVLDLADQWLSYGTAWSICNISGE
jgi:hypothetical protein